MRGLHCYPTFIATVYRAITSLNIIADYEV